MTLSPQPPQFTMTETELTSMPDRSSPIQPIQEEPYFDSPLFSPVETQKFTDQRYVRNPVGRASSSSFNFKGKNKEMDVASFLSSDPFDENPFSSAQDKAIARERNVKTSQPRSALDSSVHNKQMLTRARIARHAMLERSKSDTQISSSLLTPQPPSTLHTRTKSSIPLRTTTATTPSRFIGTQVTHLDDDEPPLPSRGKDMSDYDNFVWQATALDTRKGPFVVTRLSGMSGGTSSASEASIAKTSEATSWGTGPSRFKSRLTKLMSPADEGASKT